MEQKKQSLRIALLLSCFFVLFIPTVSARTEACEKEYSCASCSQVRICRHTTSGLKETFRISCPGDKPFCDAETGSCSNIPTQECADIGVFTCMQDGVFPDPSDCKAYHICKNGTSHSFQCAEGQNFNGTACSASSSCSVIDCNNKSGIKVAHPSDPSVFAYCLHNKPLFVDRCPDYETLNGTAQQCLHQCQSSRSPTPDRSNCSRYFECVLDTFGVFVMESQACPLGQYFDSTLSSCSYTPVECSPSHYCDLRPL